MTHYSSFTGICRLHSLSLSPFFFSYEVAGSHAFFLRLFVHILVFSGVSVAFNFFFNAEVTLVTDRGWHFPLTNNMWSNLGASASFVFFFFLRVRFFAFAFERHPPTPLRLRHAAEWTLRQS